MEFKECEIGMKIRINTSIKQTSFVFSSNSEMMRMRGNTYTIESVDGYKQGVRFKGYIWDAKDLTPVVEKEPEPIIFHFDPQHL